METNGVKFSRHVYSKLKGTDWNTEYELIRNSLEKPILPPIIKIEVNRGYNNSKGIGHWLCVYNEPNWQYGNRVTGLRPTSRNNIFEGNLIKPHLDKPTPGSLVFFEFSRNNELLVIDVFKDFYTDNPFAFRLILETHKFILSKKARQ